MHDTLIVIVNMNIGLIDLDINDEILLRRCMRNHEAYLPKLLFLLKAISLPTTKY